MMNYYIRIILLFLTFVLSAADHNPSQWLAPHNQARRAVGIGPLTWDNRLANYAKSYGHRRRNDCQMIHSKGPYGENIFWGSGTGWSPAQAVNGWVSEKRFYNVHTNTCYGADCGHYKQIVWKSTRRVGCAKTVCNRGAGVLLICEYDPPGDYYGEKPY